MFHHSELTPPKVFTLPRTGRVSAYPSRYMTQIVRITMEQDNAPVGETTGLFVVSCGIEQERRCDSILVSYKQYV